MTTAAVRTVSRALCWVLVLCMFAPVARAQTHLVFCYDPYPPYTLGTEGAPTGGLKVELLEALVDRMDGITAEVVLMPWARCQEEARVGDVDGILPLFYSDARAEFLAFSDATFEQTSALWYNSETRPDAAAWAGDYADIADARLGLLNGAVIDAEMEAAFARNQPIQRANSIASMFDMLKFGRIQFAALDAKVGEHHLQTVGLSDVIRAMPVTIAPRTAHFGLSKASGAHVHLDALNAALRDLQTDGSLARIYAGGW